MKRAAEIVEKHPEAFKPGGRHQPMVAEGAAYIRTEEGEEGGQKLISS